MEAVLAYHDMDFDRRIGRLTRKHRAMSRGYKARVRSDGLIVTAPRSVGPRVSLKGVILFLAAFLAFKAFLIASLGISTYEQRVTRLQGGTMPERAGAWVMQADPVAVGAAEWMARYLR